MPDPNQNMEWKNECATENFFLISQTASQVRRGSVFSKGKLMESIG